MKTVIFKTENGVFEFDQKELRNHLIGKKTEYNPDEVSKLLKLTSTDSDETILNSDDHHYFGYVSIDLLGSGKGLAACRLCGKIYDTGQLKQFSIDMEKVHLTLTKNRKEKSGYSEKESVHQCLGEMVITALKVTI